jgi:hypothetical protein
LPPLTLLRPRNLGVAVALVALALAACSHNSSTPTTAATASPSPNPSTTPAGCVAVANGTAFIPDGGAGGAFQGVQVVHFEDSNTNLCGVASVLMVPFNGAVGAMGVASDGSTGQVALSSNGGVTFTQVEDVFGVAAASLIPAGATYNVTQYPTASPSTSPSPTPSQSPTLSDVNSVSILGTSSASVGLIGGPGMGFLGLTSLANAPPQFGGFIPWSGASPDPGSGNRPIVQVAPTPSSALARGPNDLLSFSVGIVATGYQFSIQAFDTTLGYGTSHNLRGSGAMAISPNDTTRALIAGAPGPDDITLITGLPSAITKSSTITLASRPHSVAISTGGAIAAVGADNGIYIIQGVNTTSISLVGAFKPNPADSNANALSFTGCDGRTYLLTNVSSVGFSLDQLYLIAVGTPPGQVCAKGYDSSLVAIAFNTATGVPPTPAPNPSPSPSSTPGPTQYTANGIVTRPVDTDYVIVR